MRPAQATRLTTWGDAAIGVTIGLRRPFRASGCLGGGVGGVFVYWRIEMHGEKPGRPAAPGAPPATVGAGAQCAASGDRTTGRTSLTTRAAPSLARTASFLL